MRHRARFRIPVSVLALALTAAPAWGVDGVIEINQARAAAGGVTTCDGPGFPVTLCTPGSYRLTSNLDYPSAAAHAIHVTASDVSIDLNGMTITGTNSCGIGRDGWVLSCTQSGSSVGDGIIGSLPATRTRVFNGRIAGAGRFGIVLSFLAQVSDVQVTESASDGMNLGERSLATGGPASATTCP